MPIFDYECDCGNVKKDQYVHRYDARILCFECGGAMKKMVATGIGASVFPQDGVFLEHVGPDGKLFHSKDEMRDFEKKTGTTIGMLH